MGTFGSPLIRLTDVHDKLVRSTRRPADLSFGGPHYLLKTFWEIPQTTS